MKKLWMLCLLAMFGAGLSLAQTTELLDFPNSYELSECHTNGATLTRGPSGKAEVRTNTTHKYPAAIFHHPEGKGKTWDVSKHKFIVMTVKNLSERTLNLHLRVDAAMVKGTKPKRVGGKASIPGKSTGELRVLLRRNNPNLPTLVGMDGFPQGMDPKGIDTSQVEKFNAFTIGAPFKNHYEVLAIRAEGTYASRPHESLTKETFFPMLDKYGQFRHADWDGKVTSDEQLQAALKKEQAEIASQSRPDSWNGYGGWKNGPSLEATGHFYAAKHEGKWWLVDPEGKLFFSQGICGVGPDRATKGGNIINEREHYFEWLPKSDGSDAMFYGMAKKVKRGYYKGKQDLRTFSFAGINLKRKYGENWQKDSVDFVHKRLPNWGINTAALWSSPVVMAGKKTPYTDWIFYWPPGIKGKTRHWKKMIDVYDPQWKVLLTTAAKNKGPKLNEDPYCIGIFVDNEIAWHTPEDFLVTVMTAPANQPAKKALVAYLKKAYTTVDALNSAWSTKFGSWNDMLKNKQFQYSKQAGRVKDGTAFYTQTADIYYKTVRDVVKAHAPNKLYLGSRLHGNYPIPSAAAARYCDVVGYNLYRELIDDFQIPGGIDKPVIVGEFHFGADDRGMFGRGLVPALSQSDRAAKYKRYVGGAIKNPNIVGTHWFIFRDEPVIGRAGDQENHNVGFVDVTDQPYPLLIKASRELGATMYSMRSGK